MHQCSQFKNLGRALHPPHIPYPRRLRHLCPLCPTHFLVPSGAYDHGHGQVTGKRGRDGKYAALSRFGSSLRDCYACVVSSPGWLVHSVRGWLTSAKTVLKF